MQQNTTYLSINITHFTLKKTTIIIHKNPCVCSEKVKCSSIFINFITDFDEAEKHKKKNIVECDYIYVYPTLVFGQLDAYSNQESMQEAFLVEVGDKNIET